MTTPLHERRCRPLRGMEHLIDEQIARTYAAEVSCWALDWDGQQLRRDLAFKDFPAAIAFVNWLAARAEEQNHHPDIDIRYSKVSLGLSTHDVGGLSENDFILAAVVDQERPCK